MEKTTLQTASGHFVCAEEGGGREVNATRTVAAEWETFEVERRDNDRIALRTSGGFYIGTDHSGAVHAKATAVGEWEEWEAVAGERDGSTALFQPFFGTYLGAVEGGGDELYADSEAVHDWESFDASADLINPPVPEPGPGPALRIVGPLRTAGMAIIDSVGQLVKPKILHAMFLFSDWVHDHKDRVRAELEHAVDLPVPYDGIRFCDHLGYYSPPWNGMEIGPFSYRNRAGGLVDPTPDYYGKLEEFLNVVRSYGLGVHHSRGDLNGLNVNQIFRHIEDVARVQRNVGLDMILLNEACNEAWQNMPATAPLVETLKAMCSRMPKETLKASSAANDDYGGETEEAAREYLVDIAYKHGYRGGETGNRLGHIHAFAYETLKALGVAGWEGEPAGPSEGVTVGREDSIEGVCLMGIQMAAFSQGATYMSGAGVFGRQPIWIMPGYAEWPRGIELLPHDVMTFDKIMHGGDTWRGKRIFAVDDRPGTRCDQRLNTKDGRFIATIYGQPGSHNIPVEKSCEVTIYTPHTAQAWTFELKKDTTWPMSFDKGRLIVGQLT